MVIQRHPQSGQPAQTAPGGEHHPGLSGFPFADSAFVHIQAVGQLDVSQGDKAPDQQDFVGRGYLPVFSADQRIAITLFSLSRRAAVLFVNGVHYVPV